MKYKYETLETLVPIETEPINVDALDGLRITHNGQLDVLHQIMRYGRTASRKAGTVALRGLEETINVLDEVMYPAKVEQ